MTTRLTAGASSAAGGAHPLFARFYAGLSAAMDRGYAEYRRRLLAGLSGRVIEVGAGNGLNFAHYPESVTDVVAVEPEPYLRARASRNVTQALVPVRVVAGVAERLPGGDGSFDAAVVSLVLCSVDDQARVLHEIRRVVRPGGQLRFFEHVQADTPLLQRTQRVLDRTVWPHVAGGCHTARDTSRAIEAAGFRIVEIERFRVPQGRLAQPTSPHVLGTALRS